MSLRNLHVVLTGPFEFALQDWRTNLVTFNRSTMLGTDRAGRTVLFVHASRTEKLRGLRITSYEIHDSAYMRCSLPEINEARAICESRMAMRYGSAK